MGSGDRCETSKLEANATAADERLTTSWPRASRAAETGRAGGDGATVIGRRGSARGAGTAEGRDGWERREKGEDGNDREAVGRRVGEGGKAGREKVGRKP